jgi:hypothetical protein
MKRSVVRQRIRDTLNALPGLLNTRELAAAVIDKMSAEEQHDALLNLLPALIREEDRRQAGELSAEADNSQEAWLASVDFRIRLHGEDLLLSDASAAEIEELAAIRHRSGQNISAAGSRYVALATAMRTAKVETVGGLEPEVGLSVLRDELRTARRRVSGRDALQKLAQSTDELTESSALSEARTALAAAQQRLEAAQQEQARLAELTQTMASIGYERSTA